MSVNETNNDGDTPLHLASYSGHVDIVNRLVELGASVNEKNSNSQAPLHYALNGGHVHVITSLLRNHAIPDDGLIEKTVVLFNESKQNHVLLAFHAYGFNQPVSDAALKRLTSDIRDSLQPICDLCPLQVV